MSRTTLFRSFALLLCCVLLWPVGRADAQGVTTGAISGVVKDAQGAVIPGATVLAVHQPSGTTYEAVTQADGRFVMPGMRVGGPYTVTASLTGFTSEAKNNLTVSLGVTQDLDFSLKVANVAETVTVVGTSDPVFSSGRTGAATAVTREDLATLPTISGRITDITRLTPQYGGSGTFAGQDNRANNITVDGSYFNNSFGLGTTTGGIGDRTGVAPISLEAIEQVQVSVAPYDVRQGNFTGAGVNTVTRSGTNHFTGSVYHALPQRSRYVGTEAAGPGRSTRAPSTTTTPAMGRRPDRQEQAVRVRQLREAERHAAADDVHVEPRRRAGGRQHDARAASDLTALSSVPEDELQLRHGPVRQHPEDHAGQAVDAEGRLQRQQRQQGHLPLQPARLEQPTSTSRARRRSASAAPTGTTQLPDLRRTRTTRFSRTSSRASASGTRCSATMTNNLIVGYTTQDESRGADRQLFPFVDIGDGAGSAYHLVRQRAVHAVQPAPLQHVPAAGQLHEVREEPLAHLRRRRSRSSTRTTRSTSASRAPTRTTRWPTSTPTPTATSPTRTARCRR